MMDTFRVLNSSEVNHVSGGNPAVIIIGAAVAVATLAVEVYKTGYNIGKDLAARDDARSVKK
jgi:hypothetical protein